MCTLARPAGQDQEIAVEMHAHLLQVSCIIRWLLPGAIHLANNLRSDFRLGERERGEDDRRDADKMKPTHPDEWSSSNASLRS